MDVTHTPLPGTMPLQRRRTLPPGPLDPGRVAGALGVGGGGAHPVHAAPTMAGAAVHGVPDGPDLMLPSGIRVRRTRIGGFRVSQGAVQEALRAIALLPVQHQALLARMGIPIQLLPVMHLEAVPGTNPSAPVIGATTIDGPHGAGRPTAIRIAANQQALVGRPALGETVQHEIGHAIAVMASQDRSEAAAHAYAARY